MMYEDKDTSVTDLPPFWEGVTTVLPYVLLILEFFTVSGYLFVFYFLFRELKRLLSYQRYQKIKYRTATYLALISILNSARFFYYCVMSLTMQLMDNVSF